VTDVLASSLGPRARSRACGTLVACLFVPDAGCARWGFEGNGVEEALGPPLGVVSAAPTCSDGIRNADEGGVDCGGVCAPCVPGASCSDGLQNGAETAIDCGGACGACPDEGCTSAAGCPSGVCSGGVCAAATCSDGVRNQDETDIDCGGSVCGRCGDGVACIQDGDCASTRCNGSVCQSGTCSDGLLNQDETSTDCGGACGSTCSVLQAALIHRYRFEGAGTVISDSVGAAHGVLVNASLTGSGSVLLAGGSSGQYVDLPNGIVSSLADATFEAWLTWSGGQGWQKIFDFGTSSAGEGNRSTLGQRFLTMSPKRALLDEAFLLRHCPQADCSSSASWIEAAAADTLPSGVEKHVVGVFDDTGNAMRIYIDGGRVASQANAGSLADLDDVNNWLGRSQYVGDPDFAGQLHEFRIYNRALSDSEVLGSYEAGPDPSFL
jgi:hypothetical protein